MIPKMPTPAKAGVADFSGKIVRKIKENREAPSVVVWLARSNIAASEAPAARSGLRGAVEPCTARMD
jgi:hypothetical protein